MNIDQSFPSKYMKAGDLPEDGIAVPYTIADVITEEVGRDRQVKPILYFEGQEKGMVLNKTNSNTIKKALGSSDTDEWVGKTILLYSTEVQFADEMVEAIRVKLKPGKKPAKESAEELETKPKPGDPDYKTPGKQKLAPGETPKTFDDRERKSQELEDNEIPF